MSTDCKCAEYAGMRQELKSAMLCGIAKLKMNRNENQTKPNQTDAKHWNVAAKATVNKQLAKGAIMSKSISWTAWHSKIQTYTAYTRPLTPTHTHSHPHSSSSIKQSMRSWAHSSPCGLAASCLMQRRAIKSRLQFVLLISMLLALFARRKLSLTSNSYSYCYSYSYSYSCGHNRNRAQSKGIFKQLSRIL